MKIKNITVINDFLYIILNEKKLLVSKDNIYDVTKYDNIKKVMTLNNDIYFINDKFNLINITTNEIILNDSRISNIEKYNEEVLILTLNDELNQKVLYDILTKKFLVIPTPYQLDSILPNKRYVLKYKDNIMILDKEGKSILEDSNFNLDTYEDKLVLVYSNKIDIVTDFIKTINKDKYCLTNLIYHDGNIIMIRKKSIFLYDLGGNLIKKIKVNNLLEISEATMLDDYLKIVSLSKDKKDKTTVVNLKNDKLIEHEHIDKADNYLIGNDNYNYYFYDCNLEMIKKVRAFNYQFLKENLIKLKTDKGNEILNLKDLTLTETDYQNIYFFKDKEYGLANKKNSDIIEIIDNNICSLGELNNKYYNLDIDYSYYLVVNNYLVIFDYILKSNELKINRLFIKELNGSVFLDSYNYQLEVIGKYFKIYNDDKCFYLDTKTKEVGFLNMRKPRLNKKFSINKNLVLKKDR